MKLKDVVIEAKSNGIVMSFRASNGTELVEVDSFVIERRSSYGFGTTLFDKIDKFFFPAEKETE